MGPRQSAIATPSNPKLFDSGLMKHFIAKVPKTKQMKT
jgi:hypothetical protein